MPGAFNRGFGLRETAPALASSWRVIWRVAAAATASQHVLSTTVVSSAADDRRS
jgi:hypothetical protein